MPCQRNSLSRLVASAAILIIASSVPAGAVSIGSLLYTSDSSLGSFGERLTILQGAYGNVFTFNTDNGTLQWANNVVFTFTPAVVSQTNGPAVRVYNFSAFDVPAPFAVTMFGNSPAAILSAGDMSVGGNLTLWNGGGAGGSNDANQGLPGSPSPLGGAGGQGGGGFCEFVVDHWVIVTSGAGGGGGLVSPGGAGANGGATSCGQLSGGAGGSSLDLSEHVLTGGGGGGGGGVQCAYFGGCGGAGAGGAGGGAVVFETSGNFTVTSGGVINANGRAGQVIDTTGVGGGGAGGMLWFSVGGDWTNFGTITAIGGGPGGGGATGTGSGGFIYVDPASIVNHGDILTGDTGLILLEGPLFNDGHIDGYGVSSTTPEPASIVMLLLPVVGLLSTRRKRVRLT